MCPYLCSSEVPPGDAQHPQAAAGADQAHARGPGRGRRNHLLHICNTLISSKSIRLHVFYYYQLYVQAHARRPGRGRRSQAAPLAGSGRGGLPREFRKPGLSSIIIVITTIIIIIITIISIIIITITTIITTSYYYYYYYYYYY